MIAPLRAPAVEAINLVKRFGNFTAVDSVSLTITPGTVHALLGENGAGKSTLVKCLMGYEPLTSGSILVDDMEREIASPRQAHALGLGMVYQHFTLVPSMTVAENLIVGSDRLDLFIDWPAALKAVQAFVETTPLKVPIHRRVEDLSAGEKQKVEIIKQLFHGRRFLILDEPTSVLTPQEADELLGLLRRLAGEGGLSVLLITHKLPEVLKHADDVTVLRAGRRVDGGTARSFDAQTLAAAMVGDNADADPDAQGESVPGRPILAVKELSAQNDRGVTACRDVSFTVHAGEIVGVAGVSGNGQKELIAVLAGQRSATGGSVCVEGEPYRAGRAEMRRHKVGILPEEPLVNACVAGMSVAENISVHQFDLPPLTRLGTFIDRRAMRRFANALIERFGIRASGPDTRVGTLSGGNVQRLVLARELDRKPRLLIAANPCFGLDVGAVRSIHSALLEARADGAAILLVSEDLDELLKLSDRILVMCGGRLTYETATRDASIAVLGRHMAGDEVLAQPATA